MITPTTPLAEDGIGSRSLETMRTYDRPFARISWGAIFAGALFALATQIVLTLIGLSIGLATLEPATGGSPTGTALGIGAGIWLLVCSLVSLFLGGYMAGRLGGTFNGWLHGLVTWATVTFLTLLLLTTAAGRLIGTASGLANFAAANTNKLAQVQLPPVVQRQLDQLQAQARQTTEETAATAEKKAAEAEEAAKKPGDQPIEQEAKAAAEKATESGAAGSFGAALAMILGALAAGLGGKVGHRNPSQYIQHIEQRSPAGAAFKR